MYNKKSILRIIAKKMHEKKRNIVMDFTPDSDPENWRTINHAHVHLNEAGEIDGGAGGKFSGQKWTSEKHPHKSSSTESKWDRSLREKKEKVTALHSAGGKTWSNYGKTRVYFGGNYAEYYNNDLNHNITIHATNKDSEKAIDMIMSGKEKTYKSAMAAVKKEKIEIGERVKKKVDSNSGITKKDWAKGTENRTYYKVNGNKDAGYYDNKRKIYVPGDIDLSNE